MAVSFEKFPPQTSIFWLNCHFLWVVFIGPDFGFVNCQMIQLNSFDFSSSSQTKPKMFVSISCITAPSDAALVSSLRPLLDPGSGDTLDLSNPRLDDNCTHLVSRRSCCSTVLCHFSPSSCVPLDRGFKVAQDREGAARHRQGKRRQDCQARMGEVRKSNTNLTYKNRLLNEV